LGTRVRYPAPAGKVRNPSDIGEAAGRSMWPQLDLALADKEARQECPFCDEGG
jgi:hypothetical protein